MESAHQLNHRADKSMSYDFSRFSNLIDLLLSIFQLIQPIPDKNLFYLNSDSKLRSIKLKLVDFPLCYLKF